MKIINNFLVMLLIVYSIVCTLIIVKIFDYTGEIKDNVTIKSQSTKPIMVEYK